LLITVRKTFSFSFTRHVLMHMLPVRLKTHGYYCLPEPDLAKSNDARLFDVRPLIFVVAIGYSGCTSSLDYASRFHQAREELAKMVQDGSLKQQFHIVEGIEKCPETLPLLFSGGNHGKL
jgi:hypothetical protein